jgi:hypothetical protein
MFIPLETIGIWELEPTFTPQQFFRALHQLCEPTDRLVIGSYDLLPEIAEWLNRKDIPLVPTDRVFLQNFELNRGEYPNGRAWSFPMSPDHLEALCRFTELPNGGKETHLFFDHVVVFRPGNPSIPLLNFHDAFKGSTLCLTGLYDEETVSRFADTLQCKATWRTNPAVGTPYTAPS